MTYQRDLFGDNFDTNDKVSHDSSVPKNIRMSTPRQKVDLTIIAGVGDIHNSWTDKMSWWVENWTATDTQYYSE